MVEFGGGMLLFDPLKLAVLESLLPSGSSQDGPPLCLTTPTKYYLLDIWQAAGIVGDIKLELAY